MPSQHKHPPIAFRPTEGDRARLYQLAERTGIPVNRLLSEALRDFLNEMERRGYRTEAKQ